MLDLETDLRAVHDRIMRAAERAGRNPNEITLVAVSKTFPPESVLAVRALGVRNFGENRVEEAAEKIPLVKQQLDSQLEIRWHLIGHLQRRKAKDAVTLFDMIHSVDSVSLAARLARFADERDHRIPILLEVNISGEATKSGLAFEPRDLLYAATKEISTLPQLDVQGFMTLAPIVDDPESARPYFRALRELRDEFQARLGRPFPHLSMGMTDDFEAAIAEGATIVRIGRAIFGQRAHQ